jgi:hypothetical protein
LLRGGCGSGVTTMPRRGPSPDGRFHRDDKRKDSRSHVLVAEAAGRSVWHVSYITGREVWRVSQSHRGRWTHKDFESKDAALEAAGITTEERKAA